MANPLKEEGALLVPADVESEEITEVLESGGLLAARKKKIENRRAELEVESKEQNLETVDWLNRRVYGLVAAVTDHDKFEQVMSTVATGKDLNEAVKAAQAVVKLRDDMLEHTLDAGGNTGKKRKIDVQFAQQGSKTLVGVMIDDG